MDRFLRVSRGSFLGCDDLIVEGEHGEIAVRAPIGPGGPLHPRSAAEAKARPWFFTGSPFGGQIIALAWERHAERTLNG